MVIYILCQDSADRQRCSVIRMFLDYIVQTLEDDFQAKRSGSALNQSIAKSLLSCDQQFSQVRWELYFRIMYSLYIYSYKLYIYLT